MIRPQCTLDEGGGRVEATDIDPATIGIEVTVTLRLRVLPADAPTAEVGREFVVDLLRELPLELGGIPVEVVS